MIEISLWQIGIGLFMTTAGMACLYTLLSSILLYTGYKSIQGKELRNIAGILMYAMVVGFFYSAWNFVIMFGILEMSEFTKSFVSNGLLISILFVSIFMSFSIKEMSGKQRDKTKEAKKLGRSAREKAKKLIGFLSE